MEKMMLDNVIIDCEDCPGIDGKAFRVEFNKEEYGWKPETPKWESYEEYKLREELHNQQLAKLPEIWAKEFPWLAERYLNESKQGIQDNKQG